MNRALLHLRDWAELKSRTDEDLSARPLWKQIHEEVSAHLDPPAAPAGPALFEDPSPATGSDLSRGGPIAPLTPPDGWWPGQPTQVRYGDDHTMAAGRGDRERTQTRRRL